MLVFAVIISAYALIELPRLTARFLVGFTALCSCPYVFHYFVEYPRPSAMEFESSGFKAALHNAPADAPKRVALFLQG